MASYELVWYCPCCETDGGEIALSKKDADQLKAEWEAKGQKVEMFKTDVYGNRIDPKSYGGWFGDKYIATGTGYYMTETIKSYSPGYVIWKEAKERRAHTMWLIRHNEALNP